MTKERRTVSLEPHVDDYLSQTGVNASELVNDLVERHMNGGASESEILEFRKRQVKSEYESLADQARKKLEEFNELQEREQQEAQEEQDDREEQWSEAMRAMSVDEIGGTTIVTTDETYVEKWANKLNLSVPEFKAEVIDRSEVDAE